MAAAAVIHAWVTSSSRRRSRISARAPAGKDNKNMGRVVATCTRATSTGDLVREVMSQAAPTFCIQVPTLETTVAIHRARKTECLKGLQAETGSSGGFMWSSAFLITGI